MDGRITLLYLLLAVSVEAMTSTGTTTTMETTGGVTVSTSTMTPTATEPKMTPDMTNIPSSTNEVTDPVYSTTNIMPTTVTITEPMTSSNSLSDAPMLSTTSGGSSVSSVHVTVTVDSTQSTVNTTHVEDISVTSADTSPPVTTTTSTTTTTEAATTTVASATSTPGGLPQSPEEEYPDYGLAGFFHFDLSLEIQTTDNNTLNASMESALLGMLTEAFSLQETANKGFSHISFINQDDRRRRNTHYDTSTVHYSCNYLPSELKTDEEIVSLAGFINDVALPKLLKNDRLLSDTFTIDSAMNVTDAQIMAMQAELDTICNSPICLLGYYCSHESDGVKCLPICYEDDEQQCCKDSDGSEMCTSDGHELCYITGGGVGNYVCRCEDGYIYFADSCAKESVVIGVSCALVALVIILLLAVIVMLCRKQKYNSNSYHDGPSTKYRLSNTNEYHNATSYSNPGYDKGFHVKDCDIDTSLFEDENPVIVDSDAYRSFNPQLMNVDTESNPFAERPKINIIRSSVDKQNKL